jgi:hypothetical protein
MDTNYLLYFINFFELIAAFIALLFFNKYNKSSERFFLYFLWFTLLIEVSGIAWRYLSVKSNFWIYNIFTLLAFNFYFFWYHQIISNRLLRKVVVLFVLIFSIVTFYNFITEPWGGYHKITFIVGAFFTVFSAIFHFYELLNNDEIIDVKHKLSFWISTGLLLFYVGMIPFMIFSDTFDSYHNYRNIILIFLNLILYTCYSLGFIWVKEKNNN